jgi:hypothetical protein
MISLGDKPEQPETLRSAPGAAGTCRGNPGEEAKERRQENGEQMITN